MVNRNHRQSGAQSQQLFYIVLLVIGALIVITLIVLVANRRDQQQTPIASFQECKEANGQIAPEKPYECTINNQTYVDPSSAQVPVSSPDDYIGLSEQEAVDKANKKNIPNRVIERDGQTLMETEKLIPGRISFYVRDGKVYKVDIDQM